MKRSTSEDRSNRALLEATGPTLIQVLPESVEYCHVPVLLLRLLTPMPLMAALSTSLSWPLMRLETKSPLFVVWSSIIVVKLLAPFSVGASLTEVTTIDAVADSLEYAVAPPPT